MKKLKGLAALLLALCLMFGLTVGAYADWDDWDFTDDDEDTVEEAEGTEDTGVGDWDFFGWLWGEDEDSDASEDDAKADSAVTDDSDSKDDAPSGIAEIAIDGNKADYDADGIDSDEGVVEIRTAGKYRITGKSDDMQILVDATGEDVEIILDNADIICCGSPAIFVDNAKSVTITSAFGSKNSVGCVVEAAEDGDEYAAVYSEADLEICGEGKLEVICEAGYGIVSAKDINVIGGEISITTADYPMFAAGKLHVEDCRLDISVKTADGYDTVSGIDSDDILTWDYDWGYGWDDESDKPADSSDGCGNCDGCEDCTDSSGTSPTDDAPAEDSEEYDFWDYLFGDYGSDNGWTI